MHQNLENSGKKVPIFSLEGVQVLKDGSQAFNLFIDRLDAFSGDMIGLLGSNGAGKSTLLRTFAGLEYYSGNVKINGVKG